MSIKTVKPDCAFAEEPANTPGTAAGGSPKFVDRTVSRAEGLPEKQRFPVEALQKKLEITASVFAGVCAANGWRPGKVMTEAEFRQAVTSFSRAPMGAPTGKER